MHARERAWLPRSERASDSQAAALLSLFFFFFSLFIFVK
jgi:hypothetical protein